MLFVFRVVSRLQGDSLSDTRSEEERRPHISEQAVPDISCKFHNTAQIQSSYYSFFLSFFFFYISVVSRSPLCCPPPPCLCVSSGAAPLPGVDTVAGRLQECEALSQVSASVSVLPNIHHQTIKITLQPSITMSLSPPQRLLSREWMKNHLEPLVNRTGPKLNWSIFMWAIQLTQQSNKW